MADTEKMKRLVKSFYDHSKPANGMQSDACTIGDLNNVINKLAKLLNELIEELEKE